jgi:hypothetical protein
MSTPEEQGVRLCSYEKTNEIQNFRGAGDPGLVRRIHFPVLDRLQQRQYCKQPDHGWNAAGQ